MSRCATQRSVGSVGMARDYGPTRTSYGVRELSDRAIPANVWAARARAVAARRPAQAAAMPSRSDGAVQKLVPDQLGGPTGRSDVPEVEPARVAGSRRMGHWLGCRRDGGHGREDEAGDQQRA